MCGIVGIWKLNGEPLALAHTVKAMAGTLQHRGPDGEGVWHQTSAGIALGHRRLAIIDLSESGRQPMSSASGRYTISFNGEIYNFQALRTELVTLGHAFNGHSDTEVILAAVEQWGLAAACRRLIGMFAFALWDAHSRTLHLVRDRLGKKPIYYCERGRTFAFASELKALHPALAGHSLRVDRDALVQYMRFQYVPAPRSIFEGVLKVAPGQIVTVRGGADSYVIETSSYWSALDAYTHGSAHPFTGSYEQAEREVSALLEDAVRLRMISDVPLGAFLSGGIDSSLVVAYMQRLSSSPVRTFSIGFDEHAFDESAHAARVAQHLKTSHTELRVTGAMALDVVPQLPDIYDEPFGDSSQVPTYLLAKLARQHVTVALSGDGGDELFCGYNRYLWWRQISPYLDRVPAALRKSLARWALKFDASRWDAWLSPAMRLLPASRRRVSSGMLVRKAAETMLSDGPESLYLRLVSHWRNPGDLVLGGREPHTVISEPWPRGIEAATRHMTLLDLLTYLPDDILVKVDRATMAASLESRCPLLDHRLVEFAARLPMGMKIAEGKGKAILRSLLYQQVPRALVDRPKTGFGIPLAQWLRGPLRGWGESLLDKSRLASDGFFDVPTVRDAWTRFQVHGEDLHYQLWTLLMFQSWLDKWTERSSQHAAAVA